MLAQTLFAPDRDTGLGPDLGRLAAILVWRLVRGDSPRPTREISNTHRLKMSENSLKPNAKLTSWVDSRLETRLSPINGSGLFARVPIQAGEVLVVWGGTVYTRADLLAGKANLETIAVLDADLYLADPLDALLADEYPLNHSCDPNAWMRDAITLIARQSIVADEEVTADYALWLFEQEWKLDPCLCGSSLCRGRVTDRDWKLPDLQNRYAGHFTPYLNRLIKNLST